MIYKNILKSRGKIFIISIVINLFIFPNYLIAQLNPDWKKSVVLFESEFNRKKEDKLVKETIAIGTGFLVRHKELTFLITNKHIAINKNLFVRMNLESKNNQSISIHISRFTGSWINSPKVDIAIRPFIYKKAVTDEYSFDVKSFGFSLIKDWNYIEEGEDLYILGFPLGVGSTEHYSPVIRSGIIALKEKEGEFLIDANIFPGNSGGPVFLRPKYFDYRKWSIGEKTPAYLIGIISSYIPYQEIAISPQTNRIRIMFEENSGLARVFSGEYIIELIENYY